MITAPTVYTDGLFADITEQLGRPVPPGLARALRAVPRHAFLPDRIWVRDGAGGYQSCDRAADPEKWMAAAYSDAPLVTQFTDGLPSSSASMPSMVLRMLELANFPAPARGRRPGPSVLELGTGTGFNAALLCELLGDQAVKTLELDPGLAERAERTLKTLGCAPTVIRGDAAGGWPDGAPYDRLVATFSVERVPGAWLGQVGPGGRIVTPWSSAWCTYGTLALDLDGEAAVGRWHDFASYMPMRSLTPQSPTPAAAVTDPGMVASRTRLSPWAVAGGDLAAEFHIGLTVPGAHFAWDSSGEHAHTRLELHDAAGGSRATVDYDGRNGDEFTVAQDGPRRLWDEVAAAYGRWETLGRPSVDRHGMTVRRNGGMTLWLDSPERALPGRSVGQQ